VGIIFVVNKRPWSLLQIMKLYDRNMPEDEDPDHVPAELVHHFLLAICTRPGTGVCFHDFGWYPRHVDEDSISNVIDEDATELPKSGRIYNKILSNVLRALRANGDARQRALALAILRACPELVAGFWSGAALTLEPRLSSRWLANIALFGSVISLPVPENCFRLQNNGDHAYRPMPPALTTIMESVLPNVATKAHLTKGLQSPSPLVQHSTALALARCLQKLGQVINAFRGVAAALDEDVQEGQWNTRIHEVEHEARRRSPDLQAIVAFAQQRTTATPSGANPVQTALLDEAAYRLLWLYHVHLPSAVAEAHYDAGKTLQHFTHSSEGHDSRGTELSGLQTLQRLHILSILRETDQFSLSGKGGSSTNLRILLSSHISTNLSAIRFGIGALVSKQLSESLLFQHDPDELYVWLAALPNTQSAVGDAITALLDECIQRCLKTPYRYLEDLESLTAEAVGRADNAMNEPSAISPLLSTLLEQLGAKLSGGLLGLAEAQAAASFVQRLILMLASTRRSLRVLKAWSERLLSILRRHTLIDEADSIEAILVLLQGQTTVKQIRWSEVNSENLRYAQNYHSDAPAYSRT
jgi:nucleolar pre-ribosomal-associated protein 1